MFRSRFRSVVACLLTLCAVLSMTPQTVRAQSAGKLALAHVAPEESLLFVTWNGWSASDPKSTNRTEKLFAEESLQDFLKQLDAEVTKAIDHAASQQGEEATIAAKMIPMLLKTALTHPGAIFVSGFKPADDPEIEGALVIDAGTDATQAIESLKKLIALIPKEGPQSAVEEKIEGATFYRPKERGQNDPEFRIGYRASQLMIVFGKETPKSLIAKLSKPGKPAAWLTKLTTDLAVDRPSMLSHVNVEQILKTLQPIILADPMAPKILEALGVSKVKHWSSISGLDKTGMHSNSVIVTAGEPTGLFDLLPNKPLTIDAFKKIPGTAVNANVARFDLAYLYDKVMAGIEQVDPNARQMIEAQISQIEPAIGFSFKDDLFAGLGDTWSVYVSASEPGAFFIPGLVVSASVRKQESVNKILQVFVAAAEAALASAGPQAPFTIQEFMAKGEKGYRIQLNNVPVPISPTWVLTKDQLVIGLTPQLVTAHLGAVAKATMADNEHVKAAFKWSPKPLVVSYSDPKPTVQTIYTLINSFGPLLTGQLAQQGINFNLPPLPPFADIEQHLAPSVSTIARTDNGWRTESHGVLPSFTQVGPAGAGVAVALLLPGVQQAREAARRSQGKNNLKHVGLAMHNFHDTYLAFPGAANTDKKGKPLLSWRVHILSYIEEDPLYRQFHLDEPWDSEHNKKLIERMPAVYQSPNDPELNKQGKTRLLAPRGVGTIFEKFGKDGEFSQLGLKVRDITDGTSNTIMVVEAHADSAAIWTKPDDLEIDFKNSLKGLKGARVGGFHALLCDGSVRFISESIDIKILNALFTRNGGEVIKDNAINPPARPRPVAKPGDPKNNLKLFGLAFHNFHDVNNHFPSRAVSDPKGKALLSWRVQLLPYLEENELYQQFHLDEPWDSEHNKTLIEKMPAVFAARGDEELFKQGKTRYVAFANEDACLGVNEGTHLRDIRDGSSNTILALEVRADAAVIWTKPDDVLIDFKQPLKALKDSRNGAFMILMADGSVRSVADKIKAEILKALLTRDGGEQVGDF